MIRKILALGLCTIGLLACASRPSGYFPPEALPPPDLLNGSAQMGLAQSRLIIQFKQAVAYDDLAFVQTLQDQCHVLLHHVSAVTSDTHVYTLELPADRDSAAALQCLGTTSSIGRVELDRNTKAH